MKEHQRKVLNVAVAAGIFALGVGAWAANDLDVSRKAAKNFDMHNMEAIGYNDNQGRLAYHMVIQNQLTSDGQRVIAYIGNFTARTLTG